MNVSINGYGGFDVPSDEIITRTEHVFSPAVPELVRIGLVNSLLFLAEHISEFDSEIEQDVRSNARAILSDMFCVSPAFDDETMESLDCWLYRQRKEADRLELSKIDIGCDF